MPISQGPRPVLLNLLISLRPGQWTKNLFVFAALVFAQRLNDRPAVVRATIAFVTFCALSSTVYLINDVLDREQDRHHPLKAHRPVASGALSATAAIAAAGVIGLASIIVALALGWQFFQTASGYLVLLIAYSAFLKHIVI